MAKGGNFEREVCSALSSWVTNGERDDVLGRSDASGGRFTARKKSGKDTSYMSGDVTFTDPLGIPLIQAWSIECKSGYGGKKRIKDKDGNTLKSIQQRWDLLDCLDSRQETPVFYTMWNQCKRDAELSNRIPILIFRRNDRIPCIAFQHSYFCELGLFFGDCPSVYLTLKNESEKITIMPLKYFFKWIPNISAMINKEQIFPEKKSFRFNRLKTIKSALQGVK
jgi:hypothetical protein